MENTNTSQQHNRITDILHKIKNKEISVHSKTFFRLKWLAFAVLVLAICFVSVMLFSFILFTIQASGQSQLLDFGTRGLKLSFFLFPWVLFIIDVILIFLLGSLTRHTSFGYKIPGIYVLLGTICVIGVSGYIVESQTTLHKRMFMRADRGDMPLIGSIYKNVRRGPPPGYEIYVAEVIGNGEGYVTVDLEIPTPDMRTIGTTTRVIVRFSTSTERLMPPAVGETVFVSGKIVDGEIINARLKPFVRLLPPR